MPGITPLIQPNPLENIRGLYDKFDAFIVPLDCGKECSHFNPSGKPFCCDIYHAVPAVHDEEWKYLQGTTDLWKIWRGSTCISSNDESILRRETPDGMILLECKGPSLCQRNFRALSCRQFPFFPYITEDYRFIGLAYEWEFEEQCWVISNLHRVHRSYRAQFISLHDALFAQRQDVFDNYVRHSDRMRELFAGQRRRIPLLHRNGQDYLLSPKSGRLARVDSRYLPRFGPYRGEPSAQRN